MSTQTSRGYRKLLAQSRRALPDPLHGLSAYERQRILLMRPTWSERHRMCKPGQSREERQDTLLDILFERRDAYDREFHARCKRVAYERANNRYLYNEQHLTEFKPDITSALTAVRHRRDEQDLNEDHIRQEYLRRRKERAIQQKQTQPKKKRGMRMGR
jgi:hypothetical protein